MGTSLSNRGNYKNPDADKHLIFALPTLGAAPIHPDPLPVLLLDGDGHVSAAAAASGRPVCIIGFAIPARAQRRGDTAA